MGFIANFKAKRAAKKAQAIYELEQNEWERENRVLNAALDIFTSASKGEEPNDLSLAQKKGELVLWTGNAIYHEAGRTASTYVGGSSGFSIPLVAGIRYRVGSFKGRVVPGEEMQIDKDSGMVKLTNQRLIFTGPLATSEWAFTNFFHPFQTQIELISSLVFQTERKALACGSQQRMAMPSRIYSPSPCTPMKTQSLKP